MANPRIVINPFTRNEHRMRRNTKSTKWVVAGSSSVAGSKVDTETQNPVRISQESIFSSDVKNVSHRARVPPSFRDATRPVSPKSTAARTNVSHRDTPLSALQLIDFSRLEQTLKDSGGNVSSRCPASTEEVQPDIDSPWRKQGLYETSDTESATTSRQTYAQQQAVCISTPLYRAAKEIYHAGPKGEGQKVWEAYQQARNHGRADSELFQNTLYEPMTEEKNTEPPPAPFPTSLDGVLFPPLRPRSPRTQRGGEGRASDNPRRDSGFSSSSYEVPVAIDKGIQSTVDANKPLPPVPQLYTAPKVRRFKDILTEDSRQHGEKETSHTWWKHSPSKVPQTLKSKISHPGPLMISSKGIAVNVAAECGGVGGPAAAMSLPVIHAGALLAQPRSALDKRKEVGRPSPRNFHLPILHLSSSKRIGRGVEGEKVGGSDNSHATHWRDRFVGPAYGAGKSMKQTARETLDGVHVGRKKRTSDISFACQGIANEKLDRYQVSERLLSDDEMGMVPDPLFYVGSTGTERRSC